MLLRIKFTLFVSVLILIAVLLPGSQIPDVEVVGFDKFVHVTMFGTWAVALRWDLHTKFNWRLALVSGIIFSLLTEVLQILVEGRTFDLWDVLADAIGLITGILLGRFVVRLLRKR